MNYQHSYHAGNFADVVKHVLLLQLLEMMSAKPKPYYILDAYGGRGLYSLASDEAKKTGEAIHGITKLLAQDNSQAPQAVQTYLQDIGYAKKFYDKHVYPGSPWLLPITLKQQDAHPEINNPREALNGKPTSLMHQLQLRNCPLACNIAAPMKGFWRCYHRKKNAFWCNQSPFEQEHRDFSALVDLLVSA
ncbi:MAG: 23S rRNA (adenine(2030)-N(6))-methyltransferase RlmJ [Moraxella osloensis]